MPPYVPHLGHERCSLSCGLLTGVQFNALFADPVSADVATLETRTSATYGDLATVGPATSAIPMVNGQTAMVFISAGAASSGNTVGAVISWSNAQQAATDANGAEIDSSGGLGSSQITQMSVFTAASTTSFTFTMKYKCINPGTANFKNRRILVKTC